MYQLDYRRLKPQGAEDPSYALQAAPLWAYDAAGKPGRAIPVARYGRAIGGRACRVLARPHRWE
jgi:hypothetical protein